ALPAVDVAGPSGVVDLQPQRGRPRAADSKVKPLVVIGVVVLADPQPQLLRIAGVHDLDVPGVEAVADVHVVPPVPPRRVRCLRDPSRARPNNGPPATPLRRPRPRADAPAATAQPAAARRSAGNFAGLLVRRALILAPPPSNAAHSCA